MTFEPPPRQHSLLISPKEKQACHKNVRCDVTGATPILGSLYKRKGIDFDLCQLAFDRLDDQQKKDYVQVDLPVPGAPLCIS